MPARPEGRATGSHRPLSRESPDASDPLPAPSIRRASASDQVARDKAAGSADQRSLHLMVSSPTFENRGAVMVENPSSDSGRVNLQPVMGVAVIRLRRSRGITDIQFAVAGKSRFPIDLAPARNETPSMMSIRRQVVPLAMGRFCLRAGRTAGGAAGVDRSERLELSGTSRMEQGVRGALGGDAGQALRRDLHRGLDHRHVERTRRGVWKKVLCRQACAQFRRRGDKTQNVLWRLDTWAVRAFKPKVAVILVGTNNIGIRSMRLPPA